MKFHKILWETPESCKFAATLKKCRPCTAVKYRVSSIRAKRIGDEEHANARKNRISKGTLAQSICRCPAGAVVCTRCAVCHRARLDEAVEGPAIWAPWGHQQADVLHHFAPCLLWKLRNCGRAVPPGIRGAISGGGWYEPPGYGRDAVPLLRKAESGHLCPGRACGILRRL